MRWAAALAVAAVACRPADPPRVALLLASPHGDREVSAFAARAGELGVAVTALAAGHDAAKQRAQLDGVLARGVKVVVVQPTDPVAAASYVRLAHERGAKIVAYDRAIVAPDLDYYITHDSYRIGVLQAEAALAATDHKGKYALLVGDAGHSAAGAEITRGYENTLAPYVARGDVEIVMKRDVAWSADDASRAVGDAIARTGGRLDAILANSSALARGAVRAVGAAGLPHVFIAGADADAENVNDVCEGKQSIDVLEDLQPLARAAAELAKQLLDGPPPEPEATVELAGNHVPVAAVRVELVTPDNVKPLLVDSGFLTAAELPACKSQLAKAP